MTVVAWDGRYLAVDRAATVNGLRKRCQKVARSSNGTLVAMVGDLDQLGPYLHWARQWPPDPAEFPGSTDRERCSTAVFAPAHEWHGKVCFTESNGYPIPAIGPFNAWGSGKELAIGAMAGGFGAVPAALIACRHEVGCGFGVDIFDLGQREPSDQWMDVSTYCDFVGTDSPDSILIRQLMAESLEDWK